MKNPGFLAKVSTETKIKCQLRPNLGDRSPKTEMGNCPSMSVCVFELLPNHKFEILIEDDSYAGKPWGYHSPEFTLPPNDLGYLLLCINYD
jgi:hypothetical protein